MITRKSPDVDYLSPDLMEAFGTSQIVRVGNAIHVSGIAPLRGNLEKIEVIGKGDLRLQVRTCLEILGRCLATEGAGLHNVVAYTLFGTDMAEMIKAKDIFVEFFGRHPPASTWVEVRALLVPDQMVEILPVVVIE